MKNCVEAAPAITDRNAVNSAQRQDGFPVAVKRGRTFGVATLLLFCLGCASGQNYNIGYAERLEVAQQFIANGHAGQGFQMIEDASGAYPGDANAQRAIGDAYLQQRAHMKAQGAYQQAAALGADVAGNIGLGRVALVRNDADTARHYFEAAIARDPGNVDALNGIGVTLDLDGRHDLARAKYQEVLALVPGDTDSLNNLALSHILDGSAEMAVQILSELSITEGQDDTIVQNLALGLTVSGRRENAQNAASAYTNAGQFGKIRAAILDYRSSRP